MVKTKDKVLCSLFDKPPFDWDDVTLIGSEGNSDASEATTTSDQPRVTNPGRGEGCRLCGYEWESREELVSHHQSSWHHVNLKRRLSGKAPLSEADFDDRDSDGSHSHSCDCKGGKGCRLCGYEWESREELVSHHQSSRHHVNLKRRLAGKAPLSEADFDDRDSDGYHSPSCDCKGGKGCRLCGYEWESREELVSHHQSSRHQFNLKRRLAGKAPSPRPTSTTATPTVPTHTHAIANWKQAEDEGGSSSEEESPGRSSVRGAFAYLRVVDRVYYVHRALLSGAGSVAEVRGRRESQKPTVILVLGGGRFAGAVMREGKPVLHKTFVRYTVRAKQGGAQAAKDGTNATKAPKSAGSTLRRYNQEALAKEVGELLESWSSELREAGEIFVRFSTYHRQMLFSPPSPLRKDDPRLRTIPIVTRRPTLAEVSRTFYALYAIYDYGTFEEFNAEQKLEQERLERAQKKRSEALLKSGKDEGYDYSILEDDEEEVRQARTSPKKRPIQLPEAKEQAPSLIDKSQATEVYTLVKKGSVESVERFLGSLGLDHLSQLHILNHPELKDGGSFLHMAAGLGHADLVSWMLHFGVSPVQRNEAEEVAYQAAQGRVVRAAMSRFREEKPNLWDWNQAQIPPPLSDEAEAAKAAKVAEKRRKEKERKKERQKEDKARLRVEEEKLRFLNLSDREKRAMAAEARLGLASRCFECGVEMGKEQVPFEYSSNRFCTPACVRKHRAAHPL